MFMPGSREPDTRQFLCFEGDGDVHPAAATGDRASRVNATHPTERRAMGMRRRLSQPGAKKAVEKERSDRWIGVR